ncbi:MAG: PilZ domain-containing protein [Gemmataceae bacterium]
MTNHMVEGAENPRLNRFIRAKRRTEPRFDCPPNTVVSITDRNTDEQSLAFAHNLSLGGIGLVTKTSLSRGTQLIVKFPCQPKDTVYELKARVVHATERPDGNWLVGCVLLFRLTEEDVEALLAE